MRAFFYSSLGYSASVLCKFSSLPLACEIVCGKFSGDRHRQRKSLSRHKARSESNLPSQVRGAQCLSAAWTFNSLWNDFVEIWHKFNTFLAMLSFLFNLGVWQYGILQCQITFYLCFWAFSGGKKYSICYMTWGERDIASKDIKVKPCSYWDGCKISSHS